MQRSDSTGADCAVSLLYPRGERPDTAAIREQARRSGLYTVGFDPGNGQAGDGWLELLLNGLTFDIQGLSPQPVEPASPSPNNFGLPDDFDPRDCEAVVLSPGPHLKVGKPMFPVVRSLAHIAADLAQMGSARAVVWHPARASSEASYFRRAVLRWIEGGAFPGLGLAALTAAAEGGWQSEGLALFTGQELRLDPELAEDGAQAAKTALRLLNWLVEHGTIDTPFRFTDPAGERFRIEPIEDGRILRAWRV